MYLLLKWKKNKCDDLLLRWKLKLKHVTERKLQLDIGSGEGEQKTAYILILAGAGVNKFVLIGRCPLIIELVIVLLNVHIY